MDIRIDRLRLQVTGISPDAARELGRLLAEQLATMMAAAPAASGTAPVASLRVSVPALSGHPGTLAPAMAAEISRALRTATTGAATTSTATTSTATASAATMASGPATYPGAAR
jgi:hypothetical protein